MKMARRGYGSANPFRVISVSVLFFLIVSLALLCEDAFTGEENFSMDAEGARPVYIKIEMDTINKVQEGNKIIIQSGPGSTGNAVMFGNISIYRTARLARNPIYIRLRLDFPPGNNIIGSVTPMILTFSPVAKYGSVPIRVNLLLGSPMLNYSTGVSDLLKVNIVGVWSAEPSVGAVEEWIGGDIDPYPVYVEVRPYHYLLMTFEPTVLQLFPGMSGDLYVVVKNTGNGNERVDLWIPNERIWASRGWVFAFERTTIDMGPQSEARVKVTVTSPRTFSAPYHMELTAFTVHAESYYSRVKYEQGLLDYAVTYDMDFMVSLYGVDLLFVPWMWSSVLYLAIAVVLLNLGINVFTMKRRRLPRGREPGFIALYHLVRSEERRQRLREERAIKKEQKALLKQERQRLALEVKEQKEREKEAIVPAKKLSLPSPDRGGRPWGKKPRVDLSDIELDLDGPEMEIAPAMKEERPGRPSRKPLFSGKREREMDDLRDSLSLLDD